MNNNSNTHNLKGVGDIPTPFCILLFDNLRIKFWCANVMITIVLNFLKIEK